MLEHYRTNVPKCKVFIYSFPQKILQILLEKVIMTQLDLLQMIRRLGLDTEESISQFLDTVSRAISSKSKSS